MDVNKFTQKSQEAITNAQNTAVRFGHPEIDVEHLLLALMEQADGLVPRLFAKMDVPLPSFAAEVVKELERKPRVSGPGAEPGKVMVTQRLSKVLVKAKDEAARLKDEYVSVEHLLFAMIDEGKSAPAAKILSRFNITKERLLQALTAIRGNQRVTSDNPETAYEALEKYGIDLVAQAQLGKLDPVIGRDDEIRRVVRILSRKTKNNPVLIGEPGVGKTAIVEGLAQRIVEGDVPGLLLNKRVLQLDVGSLVAGTMYRGQFEERLKRVIDELKSSGAIVFIDELHMLVGAGSAGSSVDAANILKPALSRGELQVIGATTLNEYRKNIESDAALERRFQPIVVDQPSLDETIEILKGLRPNYEEHHRLHISDEALEAAAKLSSRYVTDRFLPDKAIDLVDEAASRVRMYKSESAVSSKDLMNELREIRKNLKTARAAEDNDAVQSLLARQAGLEEALQAMQASWDRESAPTVSAEDIGEVISMWTGIPLTQIAEEESARLLNLEEELSRRIIGQQEAIETVAKAVRRARAGLKNPRRPVGSFMFLGPTGVGKTELTKALAEKLFGSEEALIQIDMSEFMERHTISRLVGAPPGYVGYEEAGQLTEALRRKPYSIVVFDEVEKAHPEALQLLLQIMEEGHLSDAKGRKVDFRNAIIIMTSNIGADLIKRQSSLGFSLEVDSALEEHSSYADMKKKLMEAL